MEDIYIDNKRYFWKKSSKIPGRASLKTDDDAWEITDDEFSSIKNTKISKELSETAALIVINSHQNSSLAENHKDIKLAENILKTDFQTVNNRKTNIKNIPGRPYLQISKPSKYDEPNSKTEKFQILFKNPNLEDLCRLSWSGVPMKLRPLTWKLLLQYLPINIDKRRETIENKRKNYWSLVKQYYENKNELYKETYRQIRIDIPRTNPVIPLFQQKTVQTMFERILYIWAIKHPASGYVQGINDLLTPFYVVFLQEYIPTDENFETFPLKNLDEDTRNIIEADSFWCLSIFLDSVQDNYIYAQPGIQRRVNQLKDLIQRIDEPLHKHFIEHGVDYLQFSFRWLNNLLTRELPLHCTVRLWDTYLAEGDNFAEFLLYVCAAFLTHWHGRLLEENDFQGLMLLLQSLPTQNWSNSHISMLVAEAYRLKFLFADAPSHVRQNRSKMYSQSR